MSLDPDDETSLWHYDSPKLFDKLAQFFLTVTKFSQANYTAAHYGNVGVIGMALGSVEKGFVSNKLGDGVIGDLVADFVSGFGKPRIDTIQNTNSYWKDLQNEIKFVSDGVDKVVNIDGLFAVYRFPKNFDELQQQQHSNELEGAGKTEEHPLTLSIVLAIEGMHVLNDDLAKPLVEEEVLHRVRQIKTMQNPPWFVNICHHFNNHLCGHARSLRDLIAKFADQEENINAPFNELGKKVLHLFLDNSDGRRILIDIKHMSIEARKYYRAWRLENAKDAVPIIITHGAANGLPSYTATASNFPNLGQYFINPVQDVKGGDGTFKENNSINFYDEEIIDMVESNGIMGLQLDERRLANDDGLKRIKHSLWRHKIMHYRSELLWNQIRYIAEMLDANGLFAWGNLAIGSDYDGIVDPLNSFWTIEQYNALAQYLERHANNYLTQQSNLKLPANNITASEVIERIFHTNAWEFFKRWF